MIKGEHKSFQRSDGSWADGWINDIKNIGTNDDNDNSVLCIP